MYFLGPKKRGAVLILVSTGAYIRENTVFNNDLSRLKSELHSS